MLSNNLLQEQYSCSAPLLIHFWGEWQLCSSFCLLYPLCMLHVCPQMTWDPAGTGCSISLSCAVLCGVTLSSSLSSILHNYLKKSIKKKSILFSDVWISCPSPVLCQWMQRKGTVYTVREGKKKPSFSSFFSFLVKWRWFQCRKLSGWHVWGLLPSPGITGCHV